MDFERICMVFAMKEPFYGILLSSMERVANEKIKTMGVGMSGLTFKLYYNPTFIKTLSLEQTMEILKHEMLHVAFNHFTLWEPTDDAYENFLRNMACDMEVNSYININVIQSLNPITASSFELDNSLGSLSYYKFLKETLHNHEQQESVCKQGQSCNSSQGQQSQGQSSTASHSSNSSSVQKQQGQLIDDHNMWSSIVPTDYDMIKEVINNVLISAAETVEKEYGDIPAELTIKINGLRNTKMPKPVTDWKRYCRRYCGNEFSEFIRRSKKRLSKRFEGAAGICRKRKSNLLVAIDTSGSIEMQDYLEFFEQIRTLSRVACFHILECDAAIQYEYDYKGKPNLELHGNGGTGFQPVINYFIKYKKKYENTYMNQRKSVPAIAYKVCPFIR